MDYNTKKAVIPKMGFWDQGSYHWVAMVTGNTTKLDLQFCELQGINGNLNAQKRWFSQENKPQGFGSAIKSEKPACGRVGYREHCKVGPI